MQASKRRFPIHAGRARALGTLLLCTLFLGAASRSARAQYAPPPTQYPPTPPYYVPSYYPPPSPEEQQRERARAEKAAIRAQRAQLRREAELLSAQHRALHRIFAHFAIAPVMVSRSYPSSNDRGRFRHQAFTIGAAYRHHFRPQLGLHAGGSVGAGASHIGLAIEPGSECCSHPSERVAASYSVDTEVAPLFGPFGRAFYLAPAWLTRVIIAPDSSATLTIDRFSATEQRTVTFRSPIVTTGLRLNFGVMWGRHDEFDLNFGVDMGYAARDASRYLGLFLRFGVAFGDLAPL